MRTDSSGELVEVVHPDGSVLDVVTRSEMREQNLLHRSVYVAVFAGPVADLELIVHQRSDSKDVNPGMWDLAFGGVCDVGEDWLVAARRELAEEAGIATEELTLVGQDTHVDSRVGVLGQVYAVSHDGPVAFVDGEVQGVDRVRLHQLDDWLANRKVCEDSAALVLPRLGDCVKIIQSSEI